MTLEDLINYITNDKIALLFFFMLLPIATFVLIKVSSGKSLEKPYSYLYSIVLFLVCAPAVLSLTLWAYSMFFEQKALWQLPFFIYYLPIIIMVFCLYLLKKGRINIRQLPWSAELYELLTLLVISFASTLIIMKLDLINFHSPWQLFLFLIFGISIFRLLWKRMASLR